MTKNFEKEPLILLQVEYTSSRAKKRPFTKGDACLFKTVALLLTERLQKFAILSTATKGNDGVDRTVQFIEKIAKFESKKRLCRELEREMIKNEGCESCVALFDERCTKQLYTIAFAEDDDFVNTCLQMILISQNKIKKWHDGSRKNAGLIAAEHEHIK